MSRETRILGLLFLSVIALIVLARFWFPRFEAWLVAFHHRSTSTELASWEEEFRHIESKEQAFRAIRMLNYARFYYVPGPGYRSDRGTESKLEKQRERTIKAIANSLEEYTGEHYGIDVEKWQKWAEREEEKDRNSTNR